MAVLVKTDLRAYLDKVKGNTGKKVVTKIGSKKEDVIFSIIVDDTNLTEAIQVANRTSAIIELDYAGVLSMLPSLMSGVVTSATVNCVVEVGADITEDDVVSHLQSIPDNVTLVFKVPESFTDMEFIYNMCHKYSNIRFTGGTFFLIAGCNLGSYDYKVLERKGIKYKLNSHILRGENGVLQEYGIDDVSLEFVESKGSNTKRKPAKVKRVSSLITMGGSVGL